MNKTYIDDVRVSAVRNLLFGSLDSSSSINILDALQLSSGDYLPTQKMIPGNSKVFGGGGLTENTHNVSNVHFETIGIGRVGARCGCVFKIQPDSWVTDNALYASSIKGKYDLDFLMHFLNFANINQHANTAAQPVISLKRISGIKIPVVDVSVQKRISLILQDIQNGCVKIENDSFGVNHLLNKIDYNASVVTELTLQSSLVQKLRQSFLREAIQGKLVPPDPTDEPASELLKKIKAEKEKLIKEGKLRKEKPLPEIKPEEIPFEVPEGWVWCRLGEICTKIGSGSTPKGSNYSKEGLPFFRSQNIYNDGLLYDDITFITDEVHKQMNGTVVCAGDILLNITGGSMGRCALVPDEFKEGNVSQHVCIIRPLAVDNRYLHYAFLSPIVQFMIFGSTTGAGREGLPKYNLEQFLVPLPPLPTQRRIVTKLSSLMSLCDSLDHSIKQSKSQTEMLLQAVLKESLKG